MTRIAIAKEVAGSEARWLNVATSAIFVAACSPNISGHSSLSATVCPLTDLAGAELQASLSGQVVRLTVQELRLEVAGWLGTRLQQ